MRVARRVGAGRWESPTGGTVISVGVHVDGMSGVSHVALRVEALRAAESYYADLFGLDVAFREVEVDGRWQTVPPAAGWDDVEAVGIDVDVVHLRGGGLELALERASDVGESGRLAHVGVGFDPEGFAEFVTRLDESQVVVRSSSDRSLVFVDRYGVTWEVTEGYEAASSGERSGAWLDL